MKLLDNLWRRKPARPSPSPEHPPGLPAGLRKADSRFEIGGSEPGLAELIDEPLTSLVLRRNGTSRDELWTLLRLAQARYRQPPDVRPQQ